MSVADPKHTVRRYIGRLGAAVVLPIGLALVQLAAVEAAAAATSVTVKADQARVVAVAGDPALVVVGNPLYADVSIQQGMIVIHGRHFGTTNVLVLDQSGNELANFELHVMRGGNQNITIYKAGSPFSYLCAPGCESALQVGDNLDYYKAINEEITGKLGLSTGASKLNN